MSKTTRTRNRTIARFEERSLYLFAALVMAAAAPGARAQTAPQAQPQFSTGPGTPAAPPAAGPAQRAMGSASKSVEGAFARADSNKDGKLSREEALRLPAVSERFDVIDADHDRFLSRAEFDKGVAL